MGVNTVRAKRTATHCCTRERATALHRHTQHVHSDSDTQHRERSTACLVCHMSARTVCLSRLSNTGGSRSLTVRLCFPSSHVRATVRSSSLSSGCGAGFNCAVFSMEAFFQSALRRLPSDLAKALENSGLDDASTLANYPRASLEELRTRGFGVEFVADTHGGTGDLDTAASYDVSLGGGTAVMDISVGFPIFFPSLRLSPSSPSISPSFPFAQLSHLPRIEITSVRPNVGRKRMKKAAKVESMIPGVVSEVGVAVETKSPEEHPGDKVSLTNL